MKYPTVTVVPAPDWVVGLQANRERSIVDDSYVDADPGVYELHPVGGVFIPQQKCEECAVMIGGELLSQGGLCPACGGKGYTWPEHIKGMVSGALFRLWEGNNGRRIDQQKLGASSVVILDALVEAAKDTP
jgi:hypothetical protein